MQLSFTVNFRLSLQVCNCLLMLPLRVRFAFAACICSFFSNPFAFANVPLLPADFCFRCHSGLCCCCRQAAARYRQQHAAARASRTNF
ncbi:hypothetical protein [Methanimicrococcus hongohii]|uniref:hypothetical protein n=1 Tax=Methanimicrococcus hongohii TaxID=3028295 RepID=UPI00292DF1E0|nr:hypothetical protein [Methanimicrococcus sp. Hf6]